MDLTLVCRGRLFSAALPDDVSGKHWVCDLDDAGRRRKLASVDADGEEWALSPFGKALLLDAAYEQVKQLPLRVEDSPYRLVTPDGSEAALLVDNPTAAERAFAKVGFSTDIELVIGSDPGAGICYNNKYIADCHARLMYKAERFSIVGCYGEGGGYGGNYGRGYGGNYGRGYGGYGGGGLGAAQPGAPMPGTQSPAIPMPGAPMPGTQSPGIPMSGVQSPGIPMPGTQSPGAPMPGAALPSAARPETGLFVNGWAVGSGVTVDLVLGDVVFIAGLKIVIGRRFIAFNNPEASVQMAEHPAMVYYTPQQPIQLEDLEEADDDPASYFYRSPRIKRDLEKRVIEVEGPPQKANKDESPAILRIGPAVGMALGSVMMGTFMASNLLFPENGVIGRSALRAIPMLGMMVVMILGAVLWPNLSRRYEKRKNAREEARRKSAYAEYLDKIRNVFIAETAQQRAVIEANRISVMECIGRVMQQHRSLFERTALHSDFLELRIGLGNLPLFAEIKFPADKLSLEEDILKDLVNMLSSRPLQLEGVPMPLSLQEDYVCGVVGAKQDYYPFMRGLIAQVCALHAPDEVKLVLFGDAEDEEEWRFVRSLPHIFGGNYDYRLLACEHTEAAELSLLLERELQQRSGDQKVENVGDYGAYYVVLVANQELASTTQILSSLNALRTNRGFSVITFAENIRELPKECRKIIELASGGSSGADGTDGASVGAAGGIAHSVGAGGGVWDGSAAGSGGFGSASAHSAHGTSPHASGGFASPTNCAPTPSGGFASPSPHGSTPHGNGGFGAPSAHGTGPHGSSSAPLAQAVADGTEGIIFDPKDASGKRTQFISDIAIDVLLADQLAEALCEIKQENAAARTALPKSLCFLEMYECGMVEHLSVKNRWQENNPVQSLVVPLGIDPYGRLSLLDAHEDFHGPHGLIAGMTGSGKSETIITYILSLAVNFRPDEVSFVLIDYKGGGLAGAFDNDKARLPHLAGTITNLDGSAISRSLISIQSELKRRQALFNEVRNRAGLGTMDIYKYQELYRHGEVSEPCPHMFIISDEFAELKSQQPEFMDQLISAARIGRSLGVHLILATQKPSGVVNDQIWSNARFKVCLKVADASDSREMLKRDDAAELTEAGRYYLQVGYNEYFALGQTGYAGAAYTPKQRFEKKRDNAVELISNTGRKLLAAKPQGAQAVATKTPESVAVLNHLVSIAADEGIEAPRLWLDPIPEVVTVDGLYEKYLWKACGAPASSPDTAAPAAAAEATDGDAPSTGSSTSPAAPAAPSPAPVNSSSFVLDPVIGEYDDPYEQKQHILTLPMSANGNVLLYGLTGSGKSTLLSAMIYSLLKEHSAAELNIYILDFGAELLRGFKSAAQVGDVLFVNDAEKVGNLFRMLFAECENRRKALAEYGGSLPDYNAQAAEQGRPPLPNIVIIINNYDVFPEIYDTYVDSLVKLTRDGSRYGMYFVFSCARTSAVTYRMQPNFKQRLALRLNAKEDYFDIVGSLRDIVPPTGYGRGLVKLSRILEFQSARIAADGSEYDAIVGAAERFKAKAAGQGDGLPRYTAPPVPVLPDVIEIGELLERSPVKRAVPLGIAKEDIRVIAHDFGRSPVMMVLSEDEDRQLPFLRKLLELLCEQEPGCRPLVIDPEGHLEGAEDRLSGCRIISQRSEILELVASLAPAPATPAVGAAAASGAAVAAVATAAVAAVATPDVPDVPDAALPSEPDAPLAPSSEPEADTLSVPVADRPNQVLLFVSFRSFVDALGDEGKKQFASFVTSGEYKSYKGMILAGEPTRLGPLSIDGWYKELASYGNGLWIGDGLANQTALRVGRIMQSHRDSVAESFGYYIYKNTATLLKLLWDAQ